jgi:hypothetical protein
LGYLDFEEVMPTPKEATGHFPDQFPITSTGLLIRRPRRLEGLVPSAVVETLLRRLVQVVIRGEFGHRQVSQERPPLWEGPMEMVSNQAIHLEYPTMRELCLRLADSRAAFLAL